MRAHPLSPKQAAVVSGSDGVEAGLRALVDAFGRALRDHRPLRECAVPRDILLRTGMAPEELQRHVTAALVEWSDGKTQPSRPSILE